MDRRTFAVFASFAPAVVVPSVALAQEPWGSYPSTIAPEVIDPEAPNSPPAPAGTQGSRTLPPCPSSCEPPFPRFGAPGQIAIAGTTGLGFSRRTTSNSDVDDTDVWLSPQLDYFLVRNVSIGAHVYAGYSLETGYIRGADLEETSAVTLGIGPRVGVNIPLGDRLSLNPQVQVAFGTVTRKFRLIKGQMTAEQEARQRQSWDEKYVGVRGSLPLLIHVAPHLFLGVGPSVYTDVSHEYPNSPPDRYRSTSLSFNLSVGGWF